VELIRKTAAAASPSGDPLEFVMSDASVDRMGDVIETAGWQLDNFRKNPIALFQHTGFFPIGKWRDVGVRDGQLAREQRQRNQTEPPIEIQDQRGRRAEFGVRTVRAEAAPGARNRHGE
jgi:hypothetical protein